MVVPFCSALQTSWQLYSYVSFAHWEQAGISDPSSCPPCLYMLQSCKSLNRLLLIGAHPCKHHFLGARQSHLHGAHIVVTTNTTLTTAKLLLLCFCPDCLHAIMLKSVIIERPQRGHCRSHCTCRCCCGTAPLT